MGIAAIMNLDYAAGIKPHLIIHIVVWRSIGTQVDILNGHTIAAALIIHIPSFCIAIYDRIDDVEGRTGAAERGGGRGTA